MVLRKKKKKSQDVLILVMLTDKRTTEMQHVQTIFSARTCEKSSNVSTKTLVADTVRNSISRSGF